MEVETLGEAKEERIGGEEQGPKFRSQQEEGGLMKGGMWRRKTRRWQCQGGLEELSSVKRSKLCVCGSASCLSFSELKFHVV